ncbi:MAG: YajD family HNH nuclease [Methylovulum sp.]|nr:YajD family HNH nuclease [Methylovulum sp.]TSA38539.1 MAG: HNH nuclease family protein [Methylococcaceae bacterium]
MTQKTPHLEKHKQQQLVTEARRNQELREQSYRGQALKLYPWLCGRCAREFTHKNLAELTVHHKNHNHDDNPSDGSNWELLCLYCHDNEHARYEETRHSTKQTLGKASANTATHNPFASLKNLMNPNAD